MHPAPLLLLLSSLLTFSDASPQPLHQSHFTKQNLPRDSDPHPQNYIEVSRPLPTESLTPSCAIPILSHSFGNTYGLPPATTTYSPPFNCTWSRAVIHLSAASNGSQYDRIAAVWLSGMEILRTSTPEPTPDGILWNVHKDVTRYSSLLQQSNLSLSVMLENIVNDIYTGIYRFNLTFLYFDDSNNDTAGIPTIKNPAAISPLNSVELNENPADLIIPVSATGDEGFWFKIHSEYDSPSQGIKIPLNTYRAVIEVYVSFHGDDEFWYSNPPDSYIEFNNLPTKRGHGAYREILVKIDDNVVGSVIPFPVVFTGGINPLFWEPVVSIGAFDLPSYEIELTPFLGILLDGKLHHFGLGVAGAISFWLVDANLHLWLDAKSDKVEAGAIEYDYSGGGLERESEFKQLDGEFAVEGKRKSEFSGWVSYSGGNVTTHVSRNWKFENTIKFKKNGSEKTVEQKVKETSRLSLLSDNGTTISNTVVLREYPLKMMTRTEAGTGDDTYTMITELKHSFEEQKNGTFNSTLINSQNCSGWMLVQDHDVLNGSASTYQSYEITDNLGCFRLEVEAKDGSIQSGSESFGCEAAAAAATS